MTKPLARTAASALLALACVTGLTGCELLGLQIPDLPFELPDLSSIELPFEPTPVADARAARQAANPPQLSEPALVRDGYLTVGIMSSTVTAPSCFQLADGTIDGLDVGLAAIVADDLGLGVRYVTVMSPAAAADGACDVVMDAQVGDAEGIEVVGRYEESAHAFFHVGDETLLSVEELAGHVVAVQGSSNSQAMLNQSNIQMDQREFDTINDCFDALEAGTVEFVLCDAYAGGYLCGIHGGMAICGCLEEPTSSGMAVAASNVELQSALSAATERALTDGTNDIVRARWVGGMSHLTSQSVIPGVTVSTVTTALGQDTLDVNAGLQDGSTAGANAADIDG